MPSSEEAELFYKVVKSSSKKVVQQGASSLELPEELQRFLASQLSFTFDLIKKGNKLTPACLAVLLAQKGLGIADISMGKRYDCAISILLMSASLVKAIALTTFTGPAHLAVTAAELLAESYSVDKTCGVSDAVYQKIEEKTLPAYIWMEQGIVQWMSRGI